MARVLSKWLLTTALAAGLTLVPNVTRSDEARAIEGHVVAVQGVDIIVDIAADDQAEVGDKLELWRTFTLRHPVTQEQVSERFRIGRLRLREVRSALAIAEAESWERDPEPGDIVVLRQKRAPRSRPEPSPAKEPAARADKRPAPASGGDDAEAKEVTRLFESLRGASPEERIAAYQRYAEKNPRSRFAPVLWEDAMVLQALLDRPVDDARDRQALFDPPKSALARRPLSIALRIADQPSGAVLHLRNAGEAAYRSLPMRPAGRGYYSVTLPGARMRGSEVEYFVEGTFEDGRPRAVVGRADEPLSISIQDAPATERLEPPRATVAAWTDYADYNRLRGNDVAWQTEGYFEMRLGDTGVRALRTGFGVYRGVGGSLEELDELEKSPRAIGLTYGYLEGEIGFTDFVGMAARGVVGLINGGVTGGVHGFVRIGNDLRTNLLLGGEFLGGVGLRGIAELQLRVFEDWPMLFRTEVTNQPAGSEASEGSVRPHDDGALPAQTSLGTNDVGGRGIVQVGYRIVGGLVASVRGSYQGRTIKHSGPGLGGGVSYTW